MDAYFRHIGLRKQEATGQDSPYTYPSTPRMLGEPAHGATFSVESLARKIDEEVDSRSILSRIIIFEATLNLLRGFLTRLQGLYRHSGVLQVYNHPEIRPKIFAGADGARDLPHLPPPDFRSAFTRRSPFFQSNPPTAAFTCPVST